MMQVLGVVAGFSAIMTAFLTELCNIDYRNRKSQRRASQIPAIVLVIACVASFIADHMMG